MFSNVTLTEVEKRRVIREIARITIEILFKSHIYTFRQSDKGPIGLWSMCVIARVVIGQFSKKGNARMIEKNIELEGGGYYVGDGRIFLHGLRAGCGWVGEGLWFCKEWEMEDEEKTDTERTKDDMGKCMEGLVKCLAFTMESGEDFDGWLPTLDLNMKVAQDNQIIYKFFKKPTARKVCLQADKTLAHNTLVQSLVEYMIRRISNTG